jgi:hypothetical protein
VWRRHRTDQGVELAEQLDRYHKLTSQLPALNQTRVVYTASGSHLTAAIINDPRAIAEHKLYWAITSQDEGRYLEALLNAPEITREVAPLQSIGAFGVRDFDKYVWALPIPAYDRESALHRRLVEIARASEEIAASVDCEGLYFVTARRLVMAALEDAGLVGELNEAARQLLLSGAEELAQVAN